MQYSKLGVAFTCVLAGASLAHADQTDAKQILKTMSDYLANESGLRFDYDSTLEIVTSEDQKLGIASSGTVQLARPDKLHATRVGGYTDVEIVFNGSTFGAIGKGVGMAVKQEFSGSVDDLFEELRVKHAVPFPAADLLYSNAYDILMEEVVDIKDLGVGVIGGQMCDHLAFRTEEVDWQIWVARGENPYPCRFEISNRTAPLAPSYRIDIRGWQDGVTADPSVFELALPDGVSLVEFVEFDSQTGHLPPHYSKGETK